MNCHFCKAPATKLCDGDLGNGNTCDLPICDQYVAKTLTGIACSRRPKRAHLFSLDFCQACAARYSASAPYQPIVSPMPDSLNSASPQSAVNSASADSHPPINSASERHVWMTTHLYSSHRIKYTRFCWGKGSQTWGYVHIAGGDCSSEVVQARRSEVDRLIHIGAPLLEILDLLRSFENERPGRKPQKR